MQIDEFNQKVFSIIDVLKLDDLEKIHAALIEKGFCEKTLDLSDNNIKTELKNALQRISIEDLEAIVPDQIRTIITEFKEKEVDESNIDIDENQEITQPHVAEETPEILIAEATKIVAQRLTPSSEIPRDLQPRLAYICSKLLHKFSYSQREIAKQINLSRTSISSYTEKYSAEQPDVIQMWIRSVESKVFSKVEETIGKQAAARTIATLKANITIGDVVREKFASVAYVRGYDLYVANDFEKLINKALHLFFEIDGIFQSIIDIERENQKLRNNIQILKKRNTYLNNLVYERNFMEG